MARMMHGMHCMDSTDRRCKNDSKQLQPVKGDKTSLLANHYIAPYSLLRRLRIFRGRLPLKGKVIIGFDGAWLAKM